MSWGVISIREKASLEVTFGEHVVPIEDDREHRLHCLCWCEPEIVGDCDGIVWVHHSLDGREAYEGVYGRSTH